MSKLHVVLLSLLLSGATVLGAVALSRTTGLGAAARSMNQSNLAARTRQLTAYASKLRRELRARPPALPPLPKAHTAAARLQAPRVVYQQPPPVVVTVHHRGDDGSREHDGGGGGGD